MLPSLRQRLIIGTAVLIGALAWISVGDVLRASDEGAGLTLVKARIGPLGAVAVVVIAGVPALALGILSSVSGNALAGVFSVAAALTVLAWRGGSIEGYLRRSPPGGYGALIFEMLVWTIGIGVAIAAIQRFRSLLRSRWPAFTLGEPDNDEIQIRMPKPQALLAGLICAVVGGLLAYFLLCTSDAGQVIMSLMLAFMVGALVAQMIIPQSNPVAVLLSPALVALVAYGSVVLKHTTPDDVMRAWHSQVPAQRLWGVALALPIHYASAAVAGCAMGIGWARSLDANRVKAAD